jgi:hypothetical protein
VGVLNSDLHSSQIGKSGQRPPYRMIIAADSSVSTRPGARISTYIKEEEQKSKGKQQELKSQELKSQELKSQELKSQERRLKG